MLLCCLLGAVLQQRCRNCRQTRAPPQRQRQQHQPPPPLQLQLPWPTARATFRASTRAAGAVAAGVRGSLPAPLLLLQLLR
jgi:hypothetical protein